MAPWSTYLQAFIYVALLFFFIPIRINGPDELEDQFQEYLKQFNKTYDDPDIYQTRLEAFKHSLAIIEALNSNNGSAKYGLTKFSDLLPEEFTEKHLRMNLTSNQQLTSKRDHKRSVFPTKIDWRARKVVTKVHNQGACGACWAYSVVETIESMDAISSHNLKDLSVQEIIDCASSSNGCDGGDTCSLVAWLQMTQFKLHRKSDYPGKSAQCRFNSSVFVQVRDYLCENLVNSESGMLALLAQNGPLTVAVNAQTWQNYIGGVIEYHCNGDVRNLNHAVQVVGYDLTGEVPFYIVRNSWGVDWGEGGYLYIAVDKNMCGIANEVSALTVL